MRLGAFFYLITYHTSTADVVEWYMYTKKGNPIMDSLYKRLAATYFSTNKCSIIGVKGLNFSVRNGKR